MKTLLVLLVLLVPMYVGAEDIKDTFPQTIDVPIYCDYYREIIADLLLDYEEVLMFEAQNEDTYTGVYVNELTGTWSVVKYDNEKTIACLYDSGIGYDVP